MNDYFGSDRELLGEILRDFRNDNGYTQKQVSEYLDVDRSTYAKYETNDRNMNVETAIQLAALYNVSLDEFLGDYKSKVLSGKNSEFFTKAAASENPQDGSFLSLEELRLLNLFRKSVRKNEIIAFARRITSEDIKNAEDIKD